MDMARRRIDLRLEEEFLARVDAEAGRLGQTRTKFVERALESALSQPEDKGLGSSAPEARPSRSASSRASAFRAASQKGKG